MPFYAQNQRFFSSTVELGLAAYALFAIAFGVIFFGPPPRKDTAPST